jgi:hypothetical protein
MGRCPAGGCINERGVVAEPHVILDAGKVLAEEERRRQFAAGARAGLVEDRLQVIVDGGGKIANRCAAWIAVAPRSTSWATSCSRGVRP